MNTPLRRLDYATLLAAILTVLPDAAFAQRLKPVGCENRVTRPKRTVGREVFAVERRSPLRGLPLGRAHQLADGAWISEIATRRERSEQLTVLHCVVRFGAVRAEHPSARDPRLSCVRCSVPGVP